MKILPVGTDAFLADGDMTKLIVAFPKFVKAPKKNYWEDGEGYLMIKL